MFLSSGWDSMSPEIQEEMIQFLLHLGVDHFFAGFVQAHAMELRAKESAESLKKIHDFFLTYRP